MVAVRPVKRWLVLAGVLLIALVLLRASRPLDAVAVEPGVNCAPYTAAEGLCIIEIGDIWLCESMYRKGLVCATSIRAGDTVRWEYPSSGQLVHTTTECGADCDAPTTMPLWDSGTLEPGDSYEHMFATAGDYYYFCTFHPESQRGWIRVLEAQALGDVDCDSEVSSVDAALVLQLTAALVPSLLCQENGDVSGDGTTNAVDAALILQFVAGLLPSLEA